MKKFDAEDAWQLAIQGSHEPEELSEAEQKELRNLLEMIATNAARGTTSVLVHVSSEALVMELAVRGFRTQYSSNSKRYFVSWGKGEKAD